jgi:hypothetical protein
MLDEIQPLLSRYLIFGPLPVLHNRCANMCHLMVLFISQMNCLWKRVTCFVSVSDGVLTFEVHHALGQETGANFESLPLGEGGTLMA